MRITLFYLYIYLLGRSIYVLMNVDESDGRQMTRTTGRATRRQVLAAGGAVALGALAGCSGLLDEAEDRLVGATMATPAAFYTPESPPAVEGTTYPSGAADVRAIPATVRADNREVDLDGWSTSTATKAQDYNSSRSNKPRTLWVPDPLDDDDDGIDTLVVVLDIERELSVYAGRALDAVDERATADARATLDAFVTATTSALRPELDRCSTGRCRAIRESSDGRLARVRSARDAVDTGEWDSARSSLQQVRRTIQSDIDALVGDLDSDGDGISDGTEELSAHLDSEATIGERFVVCLPDADLPGDGGSLAAELTPERVLEYFTGEREADSCVETDRTVSVHRDLSCRTLLGTQLTRQSQRAVVAVETAESGVVTGASPAAEGAAEKLLVADDGTVSARGTVSSWGKERSAGGASVSPTLVCPVAATPSDCPCPMPALLYLRRIRHDDQLLFAGGWLLDDGALYEDAATLLAADGPPLVAGVALDDIDEGGVKLAATGNDRVVRKRPGRTKFGNITLSTPYDSSAEHLPAKMPPVCRDGHQSYWTVQSRAGLARGGGDCDDSDDTARPATLVTALDCPILHLVGAAEASNEVKFKAGAELSKAVN
jgi:hypothetical protein